MYIQYGGKKSKEVGKTLNKFGLKRVTFSVAPFACAMAKRGGGFSSSIISMAMLFFGIDIRGQYILHMICLHLNLIGMMKMTYTSTEWRIGGLQCLIEMKAEEEEIYIV
jgi:hypothetical protein